MTKEQVWEEIEREPFIPLCIRARDGRTFHAMFSGVARWLNRAEALLVVRGADPVQHTATGVDIIDLENIERIDHFVVQAGVA